MLRKLITWSMAAVLLAVLIVIGRLYIAHRNVTKSVSTAGGYSGELPPGTNVAAGGSANTASPLLPTARQVFVPESTSRSSQASVPLVVAPENTPIARIIDDLVAASAKGSAIASCRVAAELMRCDALKQMPLRRAKIEALRAKAQVDSADFTRLTQVLDKYVRVQERDSAICDGFVNGGGLNSSDFLFRAAVQGHEPSMERFAITPPDISQIVTSPDALYAYRQYSASMLHFLAGRGNARASWELARQYQGNSFWRHFGLPGSVAIDYSESAYWAHVAYAVDRDKAYFDSILEKPLKQISSRDIQSANERAAQLVKSWHPAAVKSDDEQKHLRQQRLEAGVYGFCN
jgi:hypothetical protein